MSSTGITLSSTGSILPTKATAGMSISESLKFQNAAPGVLQIPAGNALEIEMQPNRKLLLETDGITIYDQSNTNYVPSKIKTYREKSIAYPSNTFLSRMTRINDMVVWVQTYSVANALALDGQRATLAGPLPVDMRPQSTRSAYVYVTISGQMLQAVLQIDSSGNVTLGVPTASNLFDLANGDTTMGLITFTVMYNIKD